MVAWQQDSRLISNSTPTGGNVIVIGREPILTMTLGTPPPLTLYGRPGAIYEILSSSNAFSQSWNGFTNFTLPGRLFTLPITNYPLAPMTFYRALELKAEPPSLALLSVNKNLMNLRLSGWPGVLYGLETSPRTGTGAVWLPITQFTLTNTIQIVPWTNTGESQRFFRGTVP